MFESRGSEIYFGAGIEWIGLAPGSDVKPRERQPNRSSVCRHEARGCQLYLSDGGDVVVVAMM
jgi:hypothetical protein